VPFRRNVFQVDGFIQNPAPPAPNLEGDEDFGVPAVLGAPGTLASGLTRRWITAVIRHLMTALAMCSARIFSDTFTPSADATAIILESVSGQAVRHELSEQRVGQPGPGGVPVLPVRNDPDGRHRVEQRGGIDEEHIRFLVPGVNGAGVVLLDSSAYTTNEAVTVQVGDSDLIGAGQTTVTFGASSRTNRTTVTLFESTHPGLFKGIVTLVAGVAGTNQLRVQTAMSSRRRTSTCPVAAM